jgi:hypothetical protein
MQLVSIRGVLYLIATPSLEILLDASEPQLLLKRSLM